MVPRSGAELREATGIKKSTLEMVLRRLTASGMIVRTPAEWKGPNGDYRYSLNADIFGGELATAVDAVDPVDGLVAK